MNFKNPLIDIDHIQPFEELSFKKMDMRYRKLNLWQASIWSIFILMGTIAAFVFVPILSSPLFALGVIFIFVVFVSIIFLLAYKSYDYMGYLLRQQDIIYKSGIIFRSQTVVPFCRIQHCETNQGPIDRWFGLAELAIFTAGGSGGDLVIPGLKAEDAEKLKAFITKSISHDEEE